MNDEPAGNGMRRWTKPAAQVIVSAPTAALAGFQVNGSHAAVASMGCEVAMQ